MDVREKLVELLHKGVRCPGVIDNCNDCPYYSFEKACDEFGATVDLLIANGVTVQEWISANEPPKDTCEYWIAYKAGGDYSYSTGYFDGKCWRSALTHHKIPVTHWMPLPEPPKGE